MRAKHLLKPITVAGGFSPRWSKPPSTVIPSGKIINDFSGSFFSFFETSEQIRVFVLRKKKGYCDKSPGLAQNFLILHFILNIR